MQINDKVAVVTGAGGGIGLAVARQLAHKGARAVAMVDVSKGCMAHADALNSEAGGLVARGFCGDVCDSGFRVEVFAEMENAGDLVRICVPAAGILRDALAVKVNRETGKAELYDEAVFRTVMEVNLMHPLYWTMEMLARICEARAKSGLKKWSSAEEIQGSAVLIGSVSSRGNRGQISYSSAKSALNAAAKTLNIEGMAHGVQTKIVHPGFVNTPMIEQLPDGLFDEHIKPRIPLNRMIEPIEIAEAVCLLVENPALSGQLWADGGLAALT